MIRRPKNATTISLIVLVAFLILIITPADIARADATAILLKIREALDIVAVSIKERLLQQFQKAIEQKLLSIGGSRNRNTGSFCDSLTGSVQNIPFVTDWSALRAQAEHRGESIARAEIANTPLCDFLEKGVHDAFRVRPEDKVDLTGRDLRGADADPATLKYRCTMPEGFNLNAYQDDPMNNGGWEAFQRLLRPENNIYGLVLGFSSETAKRQELQAQADINDALAGQGYPSIEEECPAGQTCLFLGKLKEPGSYLAAARQAILQSKLDKISQIKTWPEVAAQFSSLLTGLINSAVNNIGDFCKAATAPEVSIPPPDPTSADKNQYCTAPKPDPAVIAQYAGQFDPFGFAAQGGPICGVVDPDNPASFQDCVNQCLQTLGAF